MSLFTLIFALVIGVLFGNYLTTFYSRITQQKPINGILEGGMKPHCDSCGHELRFYEYFPVLSWVFCRFRCNYCGVNIPVSYFIFEILGLLQALFWWWLFDVNTIFVICFLGGIMLTLYIALELHKHRNKS